MSSDADDRIHPGFDVHLLADGVFIAEELLPGVVAQHAHMRGTLILLVSEEAALAKSEVRDLGDFSCRSLKPGAGHLFAVVLYADFAYAKLADVLIAAVGNDDMGEGAESHDIVDREFFAGQHLRRGPDADDGHVKDPDHVGAEGTDPLGDAIIEPVDDRRNGDDRCDADDDAEDGQARTQLICPQGIEGHLDRFTGLSLRHKSSSEGNRD